LPEREQFRSPRRFPTTDEPKPPPEKKDGVFESLPLGCLIWLVWFAAFVLVGFLMVAYFWDLS